jgi:hypothetical protein
MYMMEVEDQFGLTDGHVRRIMMGNASSNSLISWKLQSTLDASCILWPPMRNHIPCRTHVMQLALSALMGCIGGQVRTKSGEAHKRNHQFGGN